MSVATLGSSPPDKDGKPIGERLLKLAIVIAGAGIVYWVFGDLLTGVIGTTTRAKLDGDFMEISKAIDSYELNQKKTFQDADLDKLQGISLQNTVRDPWGKPYVFDWFFRRLVCLGKDTTLQTLVPGQASEPGESDDEVRALKKLDRIVYARAEGSGTVLELADCDGTDPKVKAELPAGVVDVRGLPAKEANLVALSIKEGAGAKIAIVNIGEEKAEITPLTKPGGVNAWPSFYGPTTEWIFYQSDAETPGKTQIYKMSYKDKVPARLTSGEACAQPSVELKNRWVWYSQNAGGNWALYRFQFSSYAEPQRRMAAAGRDLKAPAASASGDYVAYLATAGGKTVLEVVELASMKVLFTQANVVPDSGITWSPDDEKIGFLVREGDQTRMCLAHVRSKVTVVLPPPVLGRSFAWLHD